MNAKASDCDRASVEHPLRVLYTARAVGEFDRLCGLFATDVVLKISGSSDGKPIAIAARGAKEIRSWLGVLVRTFRLSHYEILSMVIEGPRAAVQWWASIHSRITGASVDTELTDIFEVKEGFITSYVELFVPA